MRDLVFGGMNDISEIQRLANAFEGLAINLAELVRIADRRHGEALAARAIEPAGAVERAARYPDRYTPIPPNGERCEFTGLRHAKLYHVLSASGPVRKRVRVANLRTPGAKRGQTLFHVGDMLRYLDELAGETAAANKS